ncbi:hypothetical protein [Salisediminibacterium selenitireducens]|uniref:Uncharacterized protein n=1 Tax=Bacillus selenitireducens (strain ATCC 700615 / DSM 15326 / MLS10) TaxID=439292 RepID=D6XW39_BACIE|nr:hypothetical protein [Salisediminibacterium selenitireducens]ADH99793.1 hypothetical protein Bsel_2290 [[Bacillus] selenitireducens MLS10]
MNMDEKGFILFETMLSLFILAVTVSFVIPSLIHIQELRSNTLDHSEAIRFLDYEIREGQEAAYRQDEEGKYYYSESVVGSGKMEVCIHWKEARNSENQWCLETLQ